MDCPFNIVRHTNKFTGRGLELCLIEMTDTTLGGFDSWHSCQCSDELVARSLSGALPQRSTVDVTEGVLGIIHQTIMQFLQLYEEKFRFKRRKLYKHLVNYTMKFLSTVCLYVSLGKEKAKLNIYINLLYVGPTT